MILEIFLKTPRSLEEVRWLFGNGEYHNRPTLGSGWPVAAFTRDISTEDLENIRISIERGILFRMYPVYDLSRLQEDFLKRVEHEVRIVW